MNDTESSLDNPYPMDELEKDLKRAKGPRRAPWLLGGLVLGIAGTLLLPPLLRPYLPDSFRGEVEVVTGPILGEERDGDRLLLTIQAEQGALLATFTERVAEINLLVDKGDSITLGVARYEPFVENPTFEGVVKGEGTETLDPVEEGQPAAEDGDPAGEPGTTDDAGDTEGPDLDAAAEESGTPQDTIPVPGSPG